MLSHDGLLTVLQTFQKSDLPQKHWVLPGMDIPGISWDRFVQLLSRVSFKFES